MNSLPWFVENPQPDIYAKGHWFCLDIETNSIEKGHPKQEENHLIVGYIKDSTGVVHTIDHPTSLVRLVQSYAEKRWFMVAHNAKFELGWLARYGFPIDKLLVYDTQIAEKRILSNMIPLHKLSLDKLSVQYGGTSKNKYVDMLMKNGVDPGDIPYTWLYKRCVEDVENTINIFKQQVEYHPELLPVIYTACLFTPVAAEIELTGMCLDEEIVHELYTTAASNLQKHTIALDELAMKVSGGVVNWNSAPQKVKFIYTDLKFKVPVTPTGKEMVTPKGQPSTDEIAINSLVPKNANQRKFLEHFRTRQKLEKQISTYFSLYLDAINKHNGIIKGYINQTNTATHRLSSSKPNLQNQDRKLKKVFKARNQDWKIRQCDYSQLEYRAAGFLAQCPEVLRSIKQGADRHAVTASIMFPEFNDLEYKSPAWSELRTAAKSDTFKPLYGGMSGTPEQQAYYKHFIDTHTGIKKWHENLIDNALTHKEITLPTGQKFFFPNIRVTKSGYVDGQTIVKNYGVQYFATAEIAIIGAVYLWHLMKIHRVKSFIVNEVHDSVIIEEHPNEHALLESLCQEGMVEKVLWYLEKVYGLKYNYQLEIEQEVSSNWGYDKYE